MHLRNDAPSLFLLTTFARRMRMAPTRSEALMWGQLKGRKVDGVRFRRQAVLGGCIVDSYAACERLVVEVDGAVHRTAEARVHDAGRQAWLEGAFGVRFVRVDAELVERDVLAALERVREGLR
ncbi:MAG TPA: DUF559 domain-containing protein [Polyangiaceae bacterium]|nr:DUF559 domain-containing protein [Polyangiaceae bacterium]